MNGCPLDASLTWFPVWLPPRFSSEFLFRRTTTSLCNPIKIPVGLKGKKRDICSHNAKPTYRLQITEKWREADCVLSTHHWRGRPIMWLYRILHGRSVVCWSTVIKLLQCPKKATMDLLWPFTKLGYGVTPVSASTYAPHELTKIEAYCTWVKKKESNRA